MEYPTRCKIVDVDGANHKIADYIASTPPKSKPHIGKEGLAERVGDDVRITLDDGTIIMGYDCWWTKVG